MSEEEYNKYIEEQRDKNEYYKDLKTEYEYALDNALLRIEELEQQLKDKDEKISKVIEFITKYDLYSIETVESEETKNKTCVPKMVNQVTCFRQKRLIREILESNKDD